MRRLVYYGYNKNGDFEIKVVEADFEFTSILTRAECNKIANHMKFGKKGDQRVIEFVDGREVK